MTHCFIAKEENKIINKEGACAEHHSPCSTFKIALSLMGFHENILVDATTPNLPYQPGYDALLPRNFDIWQQPHNPTTWVQNSCVWYSQILTQKMGMEKLKTYLQKFNYGNGDLSGDPGKNNGLTHSWLSSSLKISPEEQIIFLEKLIYSKLPVSQEAQEHTRNILYVDDLQKGWKLFGKTGSGSQLDDNGIRNPSRPIGWFVGWIIKGQRQIIFSMYAEDDKPFPGLFGNQVKERAIEKLLPLIADGD